MAPVFQTELASQQMLAGDSLVYTLPKIVDSDEYRGFILSHYTSPSVSFAKLNTANKEN